MNKKKSKKQKTLKKKQSLNYNQLRIMEKGGRSFDRCQ